MAKVKISGIANYDDALNATNLGADYISFNFIAGNPKKVSEKLAADVASKLPPFVLPVGAFADADHKQITKTVKKCALKAIELRGAETPEFCKAVGISLGVKTLKYFALKNESDILTLNSYKGSVDYFVLDVAENLNLLKNVEQLGVPFFVGGNITAEDIPKINEINPFGFDGDSGIERLPKRKDYDKMNTFIRYAHGLKGA